MWPSVPPSTPRPAAAAWARRSYSRDWLVFQQIVREGAWMSISSGLDLSQVEMVPGVRNFIEAVDIREGDRVFLLADTRSDVPSL